MAVGKHEGALGSVNGVGGAVAGEVKNLGLWKLCEN